MLWLTGTVASALLAFQTSAQLLFPANAHHQLPFQLEPLHNLSSSAGPRWTDSNRVPRVAIIGAGAAGSSAAYFLRHFGDVSGQGLETDVTVYDAADYVGGRSTVIWPWNDDPLRDPRSAGKVGSTVNDDDALEPPVELGASIFVAANKNLQKARRVFELEEDSYGGEEGNMAIWDGEQFIFEEKGGASWDWWHKAKLLWRSVAVRVALGNCEFH